MKFKVGDKVKVNFSKGNVLYNRIGEIIFINVSSYIVKFLDPEDTVNLLESDLVEVPRETYNDILKRYGICK